MNTPTKDISELEMLTDLPAYPFNHSQHYWFESRLSRNFRFRKHARHELLGTPVADWNPMEAKWRNYIKVAEHPWIRDHVFDGTELYPAAGMIVMAIEAARQVANPLKSITGYRFNDVTFAKALVLSMGPEGVETQFYLHPRSTNSRAFSEWHDFRLYLYSNDEWLDICWGTIITEYEEPTTEIDDGRETLEERKSVKDTYARGERTCRLPVVSKQLYENLNDFGFYFGSTFQTLKNISYSDSGEAKATLELREWTKKVDGAGNNIQSHVIHPTALDGIFQLTMVAITKGGWEQIPVMVPTNIQDLWISHKLFAEPSRDIVKICSSSMSHGYREATFDIFALGASDDEPLIIVENYRATAVNSLEMASAQATWRRLCFNIDWKPDIDMLHVGQLSAHLNDVASAADFYSETSVDELELVCLYFMVTALESVSQEDMEYTKPWLGRYVSWLRKNLSQQAAKAIMSSSEGTQFMLDEQYRESRLAELESSGPEGRLFVVVGRNLISVLRGEADALDLLFTDDLMQNFYSSSLFTANNRKVANYVDLLAHKDSNLSILEIGAGTGGATAALLQALEPQNEGNDPHGTFRYHRYTYTDVSPAFFESARERFKRHSERLVFQTLDIEQDPLEQGFEVEQYDVVVASFVLHATSNIDLTLKNTRKLLKPGGKLILFEPCNLECARSAFAFGLLPGWWLGIEDYRYWGPLLSESKWQERLSDNGFQRADITIRDYEDPRRHSSSVMISTAAGETSNPSSISRLVIIVARDSAFQYDVGQALLATSQVNETLSCEVISLNNVDREYLLGAFCIFLPEIEAPFLYNIQGDDFKCLQHLVLSARDILWVHGDGWTDKPEMDLVHGFGRSVRSENYKINFTTLSIERVTPITRVVAQILNVVQAMMGVSSERVEPEYLVKDEVLHISRIVEANSLSDDIFLKVARQEPEPRKFGQEPRRALMLTVGSPGMLDTLQFVDDPCQGPLASSEVEINVHAVGVNFKNVMVALGQLPDVSLGQECAGTIKMVGDGVDQTLFKPGDRVCCLANSAFKTYVRSDTRSVCKIPEDMSFSVAAAVPAAYCTAYYALFHLARLREGESILIHSAAGGVGQAAVQLAKSVNSEIYVTVGTNEKRSF